MKIAMISGNGGSGGLMAYLRGLLSVKTADEVLFVCTQEMAERIGTVAENITMHITPYAKESAKDIFLKRPLPQALVQAVEDFCPDVVLFMNGWIRRGLEKFPNIMILHNQLYVDNAVFKQTATLKLLPTLLGFRRAVRWSMKSADGVVFLSEKSMRDAQKNRIKFKKGAVVYFGIPQENFVSAAQEHTDKQRYKLLYVSSFYAYKNHDALLAAIAELKKRGHKLHIDFIGSGPAFREQALQEKVQALSLQEEVSFCGAQPHEQVLNAMDSADVFAYPSAVESTGLGVMEAMARGMCVACSDKSCMSEVLKDAGLYFNPEKPQEIAEVIEKMLLETELRAALSGQALEYAKAYTWENAVKHTFAFLEGFKLKEGK